MKFSKGVMVDNVLWCVELTKSILVSINTETGELEHICDLDKKGRPLRYQMMLRSGDNIVIAPYYANDFVVYNIRTKLISSIDVSWKEEWMNSVIRCGEERKIGKLISYGEKVFAIGHSIPGIIVLDLPRRTSEVVNLDDTVDITKRTNFYSKCCSLSFNNAVLNADNLLVPLGADNKLLSISLADRTCICRDLNTKAGIMSFCKTDNYLIFLTFDREILGYDFEMKLRFRYENVFDEGDKYINLSRYENDIWLIPVYGDRIRKIMTNEGANDEIILFKENVYVIEPQDADGVLYLINPLMKDLVIVHLDDIANVKKVKLKIPKIMKELIYKEHIFNESVNENLEYFLDFINEI